MRRTRLVAAAGAVLLAVTTTAVAQAQLPETPTVPDPEVPDATTVPDPFEAGEGTAQQAGAPDTDFTPVAKDGREIWAQVHGAHYPNDDVPGDSVTDFRDALYDVSFLNPQHGYAGGARKIDCGGTPTDVPVMYRYGDLGGSGLGWRLDFIGSCDHPGFVGAIAWVGGTGEAVAVGGTGSYPYREPAYTEDCQVGEADPVTGVITPTEAYGARCDRAGDARAWRMTTGRWREITEELPTDRNSDPPRGMTALAFAPTGRFGFAGALGQLWRWRDEGFDTYYDRHSPCPRDPLTADVGNPVGTVDTGVGINPTAECEFVQADRFRFRVREIVFDPVVREHAFAITDGCCSEAPVHDSPNVLVYGSADAAPPRWYANTLDPLPSLLLDEGAPFSPGSQSTEPGRLNSRQEMPDSFYSLTVAAKASGVTRLGAIAAPAAPEGTRPERSLITQPYCLAWNGRHESPIWYVEAQATVPDQLLEAMRARLSSVRLVSGDGDAATSFGTNAQESVAPQDPEPIRPYEVFGSPTESTVGIPGNCFIRNTRAGEDGIPDWAVGELRSTRTELGSRGAAYSTVLRPSLIPDTLARDPDLPRVLAGELPTDDKKLKAYAASLLLGLDSYSLNAIDVLDSGEGWAVGEHGAILHQGGSNAGLGGSAAEPQPPHLGSRPTAQVSGGAAYGSATPAPGLDPGPVPALAWRPRIELDRPQMFSAGSPFPANDGPHDSIEDVQQLVMSRDGSEGWAIGATTTASQTFRPATTSVSRYDGQSWSRCDPVGVEGQLPPDPACEALTPLRDYVSTPLKQARPVLLLAAARVPLEYDGDPSNDDEFKIVAATSPYRPSPADPEYSSLVTYENGRWRPEPYGEYNAAIGSGSMEPKTVAFTAPDDGWVLASTNTKPPTQKLLHFDGRHWRNCIPAGEAPAGCGDPGCTATGPPGLLCFRPADGSVDVVRGMVSSGRDLFLYGSREFSGERYPFVIHRHADGQWSADAEGGGFDPVAAARSGGPAPATGERGEVQSLALAPSGDGLEGWAVGSFSTRSISAPRVTTGNAGGTNPVSAGGEQARFAPRTSLMRLVSGAWSPFDDAGPVADYLTPRLRSEGYCSRGSARGAGRQCEPALPDTDSNLQITLPDSGNGPTALIAQRGSGRLFGFDPDLERWEIVDQPRPPADFPSDALDNRDGWLVGPMKALAPDGEGGIWAVAGDGDSNVPHDDFEHFTARPPAPVFTETSSPLREGESFTSLAASPNGTVWATTRSGIVFRYDRALGWDRVPIPHWDPGIVTRPSRALAVAAGPNGEGVVVGEGGRIADLEADQVRLDRAAGTSCSLGDSDLPPCGTGFDLLAVAISPDDGSAIAGGRRLSLVWRPGHGDFRAITPPPGNPYDSITGVAMPHAGEAYVATDSGQIFRGTGGEDGWSWVRENLNPRLDVPEALRGDVITLDSRRFPIALRALSIDGAGHGYAVGNDGLILERVGGGERAWRRLRAPFADDLTSVTLPSGGGEGAVIGGRNGLVLTANGAQVDLARPADSFDAGSGSQTGSVVGVAMVPGDGSGETEAWAATDGRDPGRGFSSDDYNRAISRLFHYSSDPSDPWMDPEARGGALPDTPAHRSGELSFAALGRAECRRARSSVPCLDMNGSDQDFEEATKRAAAEIAGRASQPGGPAFTLFTGDAIDTAGAPGAEETERQLDLDANGVSGSGTAFRHETFNGPRKLRRFREAVVDELEQAGVPLFAATGPLDLSGASACGVSCLVTTRGAAGDNLAWRQTFEGEPGPWGGGDPPQAGSPAGDGLSFDGIGDSPEAIRTEDQALEDPDRDLPNGDGPLTASKVGTGGASTHYALDISRGGEKIARLVVADSSMRSLQASDPLQQPVEPKGQLLWLDRMTCISGQSATDGSPCTRESGEQAIVLTNTPTYSYGPGALSDTDTADGTQLEQILMQNGVSVVVSGRLGWNGLYYATAPGLHTPCAGDPYPSGPPTSTAPDCGQGPEGTPDPVTTALEKKAQACATASGAGAPDPTGCAAGAGDALGRVLPFVVASSAAGTFGPDGTQTGSATEGYWHGYSIVRLSPDGDPAKTIVEQRPVFDWIQVQPRRSQGDTHTIRAGKKLELVGVGREPVAASTAVSREQTTRYDEISTPAITHRFDLLEADSAQPWMPKPGTREDACDPYDCVSSSVATIDSQTGEVRAQNGNYPRTFAVAQLSVGGKSADYPLVFEPRASFRATPPPPPAPVAVPPPASPPAPAQPTAPSVNLPAAPVLPVLTAQALAPPPVPPAPPTFASEAPLDLNLSPAALAVTPPTAVSQPPTPPVNPAPPSGARREARQRQAAAQKSGADSAEGDAQGEGVDLADQPPSADGSTSMTRHDFTAVTHREQPSAWARDALLGGGLGIAALILALGVTGRPTPRRREPELPAPAWARARGGRPPRR